MTKTDQKKYRFGSIKRGILILCPVFLLSACSGRNSSGQGTGKDIILELDGPEDVYGPVQEGAHGTSEEEAGQEVRGPEVSAPEVSEPEIYRPEKIYVHICGAVVSPGVYQLEAGSRVFEGIEAAGGFREDACEDFINQAGVLQDGQRVGIPTAEEAKAAREDGTSGGLWTTEETGAAPGGNSTQNTDGRVNINTATEEELGGIAGIGAGKAAAIVQYRTENGSFSSIEEIMKVSGIKEGTFAKIKDRITVK